MEAEITKKDLLFVVPDKYVIQRAWLIKHVLWAAESPKTFDVMSGDDFAEQYGDMPTAEAVEHMLTRYVQVGHNGDLSKREQKAYDKIMSACLEYVRQEKVQP